MRLFQSNVSRVETILRHAPGGSCVHSGTGSTSPFGACPDWTDYFDDDGPEAVSRVLQRSACEVNSRRSSNTPRETPNQRLDCQSYYWLSWVCRTCLIVIIFISPLWFSDPTSSLVSSPIDLPPIPDAPLVLTAELGEG